MKNVNKPALPASFHWLVRKPLFWLIVLLLLAVGTYFVRQWMYTPQVNPHPKQKVVVRGVFPYDKGWDLKITTSFYSSNPDCQIAATAFFFFKAADVSREVFVEIPVTREAGNRYSFTYYEDYFSPGYCKWAQRFVYSQQFVNERFWGRGAILGLNREYNVINYECSWTNMLTPGVSKNAREMLFKCFDHSGRNNRFDPQIEDNEVNFNFSSMIDYDYYDANGRIQSKRVEGEKQ